MPDITVHRHGDRWAVAEEGAPSPVEEYPTRAAAELAARDLAAGGAVRVVDEDPTTLGHSEPPGVEPVDAPEHVGREDDGEGARDRQAGL